MKKYFLSLVAMAAAMLFATSCQESLVEPQLGGTTTFTVQLPDQMGTKAAIGSAANVTDLYYEVYSNGTRIIKGDTELATTGATNVELSLIQDQSYDIYFWAQNEGAYNVDDLRNIPIHNANHNTELRAAFFHVEKNFVPSGTSTPIVLVRPFSQLNLGATTLSTDAETFSLEKSSVTVKGVAKRFNTYNGVGEGTQDLVFEYAKVPNATLKVSNNNNINSYHYISMDYFAVSGDEKALVEVVANIKSEDGKVINHTFTNVPVQENYRTNIIGNLISSTTDFQITIDDNFVKDSDGNIIDNKYHVVDNVDAANTLLAAGETYVAINYIENNDEIVLHNATEYYLQIPAVDAKLNIVGDDATKVYITLVEDNSAVNGIELNIDTPSATVTVSKVGNPKVKKITSKTAPNTLILEGIVVDDIVVNGGNVILDNSTVEVGVTKGQDNQETTEVILSNGSRIEGHANDVTVVDISIIDNVEKLQDAVDKLSKVILDRDLTISTKITVTKDVVIDGNSKTITYVGSDRAFDVTSEANGANVTFKNLTIQLGSGYAERGINYNTNVYLTIENVQILDNPGVNAFTYAINLPGSSDNANVEIRKSIIKGNIALNVWGENVTVNAEETAFYSLDYTEEEGYSAVILNNNGITSAENSVINIKGGKIIALDEKGEPSFATSNPTGTGKINIDSSTEVVGRVYTPFATVMYENQSQFYSCETLQAAIDRAIETNAKSVRLIADIELTEEVTIAKDANILLDLNGKTIVGVDEAETSFGLITNHAKLTIVGPGTISLSATNNRGWNAYSSVISNQPGGNLTVGKGVVIEHLGGTDMAYGIDNLTNGKGTSAIATINGATVKSTYRAIRQFLNGIEATNELYVNDGSTILNTTGTNKGIWMQDPSKNANTGKLVVAKGAHVDDVYLSVTEGSKEWPVEVSIASSSLNQGKTVMSSNVPVGYEVVEVDGVWKVNNYAKAVSTADELVEALENKKNVIFLNDIKIEPANMSNAYGKTGINVKFGQTIDGNGYTLNIKGAGGTWDSGINTTGGIIKNITVTGSFRGIFINHTSEHSEKVVLENVTIGGNGTVYTISCDQGLNQGIEAINCTFNGWTSFAKTAGEAKFVNCNFGEGSGYKYCRPYSNTEFVKCTFCPGYAVDESRATVTFTDCTWEQ